MMNVFTFLTTVKGAVFGHKEQNLRFYQNNLTKRIKKRFILQ